MHSGEPDWWNKQFEETNKPRITEGNPYVSPSETEPIYDENAPDGYYTILGGISAFMFAIGFSMGVAFMALLI